MLSILFVSVVVVSVVTVVVGVSYSTAAAVSHLHRIVQADLIAGGEVLGAGKGLKEVRLAEGVLHGGGAEGGHRRAVVAARSRGGRVEDVAQQRGGGRARAAEGVHHVHVQAKYRAADAAVQAEDIAAEKVVREGGGEGVRRVEARYIEKGVHHLGEIETEGEILVCR